jgi:hypothetical protein
LLYLRSVEVWEQKYSGVSRAVAMPGAAVVFMTTSRLIHGARSVMYRAAGTEDGRSQWLQRLQARRNTNIAVVALANKNARILWALLAHDTV